MAFIWSHFNVRQSGREFESVKIKLAEFGGGKKFSILTSSMQSLTE
jgi:hypothetical protein